MDLHQPAPDFELPDLQGRRHKLSDYQGRIVVVDFWSAECPHSDRTDRTLLSLAGAWGGQVELLPIAPNRNEPVQLLEETARARGLHIVLVDSKQVVTRLYGAVTTPHVFVVDREGILRYHGAVDNVTFRQRQATRFFVREAVEALLQGRLPSVAETPAYGCAIVSEI